MRWLGYIGVCMAVASGGCATQRRPAPTTQAVAPATQPANDPADLTLDEILPQAVLPKPVATTRPARAPLGALQLYARARAAQLSGDRSRAVPLLRQALDIDPDSFDLNYALGIAYLSSGTAPEAALARLQRAAELNPDSLDTQFHLGRQYLARNDMPKAIEHLRLALQTSEYKSRPDTAALIELFLARALQQAGYDTASLEQYERLLDRLDGRLNVRGHPEVYYFLSRAESIFVQAGQLYEKRGLYEEAMACYQKAAIRDPGNFNHKAHVVSLLLRQQKPEEARDLAAELVSQHRASPESMDLLRQVYRHMGREAALVDELRRIHNERPEDRSMVFALADALAAMGRGDEAEKLLEEALREGRGEPSVVVRLFELYHARNDTLRAARLLIESLAMRPDAIDDIERMWERLGQGPGRTRLRLPALQQMDVLPEAAGAKLYWVARMAEVAGRRWLVRSSLEQVVAMQPPFAPAYREMLEQILRRRDWDATKRSESAQQLIRRAAEQGRKALAEELSGILMLSEKKGEQAAAAFARAIEAGGSSPGLRYAQAAAMFSAGRATDGEKALWHIIQQWPTYDKAYRALYSLYEKGLPQAAERVMQAWLAADPMSSSARLLKARHLISHGRAGEAETLLLGLFRDSPEDPAVVAELRSLYGGGREETLIAHLEEEHARHPDNELAVGVLVDRYTALGRSADALHALERFRAAVAGDTDQLYYLAHLYQRIDQKQATEDVLRQILQLDPKHAPANNDLGYTWADDGRNLNEAEAMLRQAVAVEPDNAAYLDSLGWLLYKRGKFSEAHRCLSEAVRLMEEPDPVVLDHLGDVLYRLSQAQEAAKVWQQSLEQLSQPAPAREDLKKLKQQLQQKLEQHKGGQAVEVAPVAETGKQAKS